MKLLKFPISASGIFNKKEDVLTIPYYVDQNAQMVLRIKDISKNTSLFSEVILTREPLFLTKQMMVKKFKEWALNIHRIPSLESLV
jgi:hypothetical protein